MILSAALLLPFTFWQADLAPLSLQLAKWGVNLHAAAAESNAASADGSGMGQGSVCVVGGLRWLDAPPATRLTAATDLLQGLGAIDDKSALFAMYMLPGAPIQYNGQEVSVSALFAMYMLPSEVGVQCGCLHLATLKCHTLQSIFVQSVIEGGCGPSRITPEGNTMSRMPLHPRASEPSLFMPSLALNKDVLSFLAIIRTGQDCFLVMLLLTKGKTAYLHAISCHHWVRPSVLLERQNLQGHSLWGRWASGRQGIVGLFCCKISYHVILSFI
eukprot:scaffold73096_cov24-Tisochrysis_lutea.AAC.1